MTIDLARPRRAPRAVPVPDAERVRAAMVLRRRRAQLDELLSANHLARLASVLELRGMGMSVGACAELTGVSKARIQQMIAEAHDAGVEHDERRCPAPAYHQG